ncbi:MAG: alpha/beta fold hydrolase [Candidatus Melainabacteria bacterium]|nr:alpha/beta fold hydrolase [Candidatus Melainabacteria bacterium]
MHIHKCILHSTLATLFAFVSVGFALASYANDDSNTAASGASDGSSDGSGTRSDAGSGASDESGPKTLRAPTKAAKSAPCLSWLPPTGVQPRVAMLCLHGFSLHKGCYDAFGKEMARGGIATYAMDLRGFGELKPTSERTELDFDGCLADIKAQLEQIHKNHPGLPVVILGESMGGAVALRATAFYPELINGLISSVPARDRFAMSEGERHVAEKAGLQTIFGGYRKPMTNVAMAAVQKISAKEELRSQWKTDPLMRTSFSPKEFVQLDKFLAQNLNVAPLVKDTPVLFIQGTNDKLIRPAGTWKLFERLATANRQLVLSKNSEHLIFEKGQFRPDDLKFVVTWLDRNIASLDPQIAVRAGSKDKLPVVASKEEYSGTDAAHASSSETEGGTGSGTATGTATLPPPPAPTEFKNRIATTSRPKISYWIELNRNGKIFRCNNKMEFKSGDQIRFHLIPESDGYAYLVMKAGTTGKSDVLFPNKTYGTQNYLKKGQDYPIPAVGWMQFDQNPGTEQLGLVFGQNKVDVTADRLKNGTLTCFVSTADDGSKDLCPTRMKLSWDDPMPVMIPDDFSPVSQVANAAESSLVRLMSTTGGMVAASIQLLHGK